MRLSRQPCETCGTDTLHSDLICTTCGTIVQMRRSSHQIHAKRATRLRRAGLNEYQIAAAMLWNCVEDPFHKRAYKTAAEVRAAQVKDDSRRLGSFAVSTTQAKFGRKRERTKC